MPFKREKRGLNTSKEILVEKEETKTVPFSFVEEPLPVKDIQEEKPKHPEKDINEDDEFKFVEQKPNGYREEISFEIGQLMLNLYMNGDVVRESEHGSVIISSRYFLQLYRGFLNLNLTEVYDIEQGFCSKAKEYEINDKKLLKKYFIDCIVDSNKQNAYVSGVKLSEVFGKVVFKLIESIGNDYYDMLGVKHVIKLYKISLENRLISEDAVRNHFFEIARQNKIEKTIANVLYKHFYVLVYGSLPMFRNEKSIEFYTEEEIDVK